MKKIGFWLRQRPGALASRYGRRFHALEGPTEFHALQGAERRPCLVLVKVIFYFWPY